MEWNTKLNWYYVWGKTSIIWSTLYSSASNSCWKQAIENEMRKTHFFCVFRGIKSSLTAMVSKSWQLGHPTVSRLPRLRSLSQFKGLSEPWLTRLRETTKLGVTSYFCTGKKPPLTKKPPTSFCSTPGPHITFIMMSPRFVEMPSPIL